MTVKYKSKQREYRRQYCENFLRVVAKNIKKRREITVAINENQIITLTKRTKFKQGLIKSLQIYLMIEKWFRNIKIDLIIYGKLIRNKSQISGFKKG